MILTPVVLTTTLLALPPPPPVPPRLADTAPLLAESDPATLKPPEPPPPPTLWAKMACELELEVTMMLAFVTRTRPPLPPSFALPPMARFTEADLLAPAATLNPPSPPPRSEEHTSELQSRQYLV